MALRWVIAALLVLAALVALPWFDHSGAAPTPPDREEVVFWHFWGGDEGKVVDDVVARFNASQNEYFVRAVSMPGNNLDLKLFLAISGNDPPDVVNQDDPIVADWAARGALVPLADVAPADEIAALPGWLFPAARRLGEYRGELYALPNGLDIRALYYNRTLLEEHGLQPPRTLAELDHIAQVISPPAAGRKIDCYGFLPDPRRLWSWGAVFGGSFYEAATDQITPDDPRVVEALEWMAGYGERYGQAEVLAFRGGDQKLPGQQSPLLAGRYAVVMDGQWRVRDLAAAKAAAEKAGQSFPEYGVCPLPAPPGGRTDAGWVNGNFFVVPRGARHKAGAWAFMKFWSGFGGHEREAAKTCAAGGWIPVSAQVVNTDEFQSHLRAQPLFAEFVRLAGSENQFPVPSIPGAVEYDNRLRAAAERAMYDDRAPSPAELLRDVRAKVEAQRARIEERYHAQP